MNLKELLGESYKEDMTVEEINSLLEPVDPTKGYVKKDVFDKTASDLSKAKKDLAKKMSDDELLKEEQEETALKLKSDYETLLKETTTAKHKAKFLGLGYDEKLAEQTAQALVDGNMDAVFANQATHIKNMESKLKADLLKETPIPPASAGNQTVDYAKEIETATAQSDFVKAAYLTRMAAENEKR